MKISQTIGAKAIGRDTWIMIIVGLKKMVSTDLLMKS